MQAGCAAELATLERDRLQAEWCCYCYCTTPLTAHCAPLTAHCTLRTAHCTPRTAHCFLRQAERAKRRLEPWDSTYFELRYASLQAEPYVAPFYLRPLLAALRQGRPPPLAAPQPYLARLWQSAVVEDGRRAKTALLRAYGAVYAAYCGADPGLPCLPYLLWLLRQPLAAPAHAGGRDGGVATELPGGAAAAAAAAAPAAPEAVGAAQAAAAAPAGVVAAYGAASACWAAWVAAAARSGVGGQPATAAATARAGAVGERVEAAAREVREMLPAETAQGGSSAREAEAVGLLAVLPVAAVVAVVAVAAAEAAEAAAAAAVAAAVAAAAVAAVVEVEEEVAVAWARCQLKEGSTHPLPLAWPTERAPQR